MVNVKVWLQNANGWKRLWFVASALLLLYIVLINPFVMTADSRMGDYRFKWAVEKDYKNTDCQPYWTKPIDDLKEPKFDSEGGSCWHLYTHRKVYKPIKLPYTAEDYNAHFSWRAWETIFSISGIGLVLSLITSALVYFVGRVVAWIFAGFKRNKP